MAWFRSLQHPGHITEAAFHFNAASEQLGLGAPQTEVSRLLFNALNKIQTEWRMFHRISDEMGETKVFQTMAVEGLVRDQFLGSDELRNLVEFEPRIMNHDTLRRHGYRPDTNTEPDLFGKASVEHKKLYTAYNELSVQRTKEIEDRVLKKTAELLYIVRSNIAHGEKTPYGPDLKKRDRDEQVSAVVVPVQLILFDMLMDYPNQKLFVYGTLAPGEPNHSVLSGLEGKWEVCTTSGQLMEDSGLPVFCWEPSGPDIEGKLFTSPGLAEHWAKLDHFEGAFYKRGIILVNMGTGISVANAYLAAQ